jgi:hypothetical protein
MDHGANTEEDMKRGNRSRRLFSHVPFVYTECTPRCMLFSDKTATCARERCFSTYFQGFLSSCIQCILCIPKIFIEIKYYIEKERIKEEKQRRERWWLRCRWRWATDDGMDIFDCGFPAPLRLSGPTFPGYTCIHGIH